MHDMAAHNEGPGLFDLDADHRMILDNADWVARTELYPLSERMDN